MTHTSTLYVITAPSGAGKTSLVKALTEYFADMVVSVSYTTRAIRPGEQDGVHYNFITRQAFEDKIESGEFVEYAQVFSYYYGTSRTWVQDRLLSGYDVVLEIDWQGAQQIIKEFDRCVSIFILPPSIAILRQRLRSRKQDSETVINKRLREAVVEISHHDEFDYLVVNDEFDRALNDLKAIVHSQRLKQNRQAAALKPLLVDLLATEI